MAAFQSFLLADSRRGLHEIDYAVVALYLLGVVGAGLYFSRQQHRGDDFFVGGRNMPWLAVGLSLLASLLSTITYLGAPGELIKNGLALTIGWISLPFAFAVIGFLWLPFFMRLRLTSVYEYLERRFGLAARWLGAGLFVFVLRFGWMAVIVMTASQAVARITHPSIVSTLGWSVSIENWTLSVLIAVGVMSTLYTMLGGIKAVIWTDVAQSLVLLLGMVLTIAFVARDTGTGPIDWWRNVTQLSQAETAESTAETTNDSGGETALQGHQFPPLASWDVTVRETVLWTFLSGFCWYVCTYCSDQVAMQRYFTTSSVGQAMRANAANFAVDVLTAVGLALCGMALLTYYQMVPQEILPATDTASAVTDPKLAADAVFPHYIANGLPVGFSGLVVAALFAVAMSSLDSGVHSVSTVVTVDIFRRLRPDITPHGELTLARILTVVIGLSGTGLALLLLSLSGSYNIIDMTLKTFNCALGPLGGLFMMGMFLPWVGQRAAIGAALCGLFVAIGAAWWTEIFWLAGWAEYDTLKQAIAGFRRPSPYLVTPLALTATLASAALLGLLLPSRHPERGRELCRRAVVSRAEEN